MGKIFTEKRKKQLLVYLVLWLFITIVFVMPAAVASIDATYSGAFHGDDFLSYTVDNLLSIEARVRSVQPKYLENTGTAIKYFSVFYFIFAFILMLKAGKGDYYDIEHGSSDWSTGGEQYKVLSKKEGIILAEKNYLPVDKHGNVNVLIVGRIWCW